MSTPEPVAIAVQDAGRRVSCNVYLERWIKYVLLFLQELTGAQYVCDEKS